MKRARRLSEAQLQSAMSDGQDTGGSGRVSPLRAAGLTVSSLMESAKLADSGPPSLYIYFFLFLSFSLSLRIVFAHQNELTQRICAMHSGYWPPAEEASSGFKGKRRWRVNVTSTKMLTFLLSFASFPC